MPSVFQLELVANDSDFQVRATFDGDSATANAPKPNVSRLVKTLHDAIVTGSDVRRAESAKTTLLAKAKKLSRAGDNRIIQEVGQELFAFLLRPEIYYLYDRAVTANRPVRFSLLVNTRKLPVPWETLWNPTSKQFLVLDASLPFARSAVTRSTLRSGTRPIRVLIMISAAEELDGRPLARIDDVSEWLAIQKAFEPLIAAGLIELKRVESGNRADLIRHAAEGFDVFHFIGHGDVDKAGEGYLVFTEDGKFGRKVDAVDLRSCLDSTKRRPRLAVLNACNSAAAAGRDLYSNTAKILASQIPAVIGMQFAFSMPAAQMFSQTFYGALAGGYSIQDSLRQSRLLLQGIGPEWVTPVLYLSGEDGALVDG